MTEKLTAKPLPPELLLADVSLGEALTALASRLTELAERMPLVTDIDCQLHIEAGRASLVFRAYR